MPKNSKKIIVIPARFASTRFPGKMLAMIKGKTLIQRTFENASKTKKADQIIIATDDQRILKHSKAIGAEVVMTSKKHINGTERIYEAVTKHTKAPEDAIILNVQGDEPCIDPRSLDRLFKLLEDNPDVPMATLAAPILNYKEALDPSVVKCVFDKDRNALYFSRSLIPHKKDATGVYHHLGIYAFRKSFLEHYKKLPKTPLQLAEDLEQLKVLEHGYKIKILVVSKPSIGVDVKADIKKLEKYLCR